MNRRPRRNHTPAFKAKVALAAVKGDRTIVAVVTHPTSKGRTGSSSIVRRPIRPQQRTQSDYSATSEKCHEETSRDLVDMKQAAD
jgi:hypothetical protein